MLFATVLYSNAEAAEVIAVTVSADLNIGFDSSNFQVDSCVFRSSHRRENSPGRYTWLAKGAKSYLADSNTNSTYTIDSFTWVAEVSIDSFSNYTGGYTHIPDIKAWFYMNSGHVLKEKASITPILWSADTLFGGVAATATIDYDTLAAIVDDSLTASHGSGAWTSGAAGVGGDTVTMYVLNSADSTPVGGVTVWMYPNDGGVALQTQSDANGIAYFGYSAPDTFLAYAWVTGWNPDSTPFYTYADAAFADSMYLTQTTAASPSQANLSAVTFNFMAGSGDTTTNVILRYKLSSTSSENWYVDSTWILDPSEVFEARSDTLGQVTVNVVPNDSIYTAGYQTDKTTWQFWAINPTTGKQILGEDGIKIFVPYSESGLVWPEDFE
jgi:hypothetical protein